MFCWCCFSSSSFFAERHIILLRNRFWFATATQHNAWPSVEQRTTKNCRILVQSLSASWIAITSIDNHCQFEYQQQTAQKFWSHFEFGTHRNRYASEKENKRNVNKTENHRDAAQDDAHRAAISYWLMDVAVNRVYLTHTMHSIERDDQVGELETNRMSLQQCVNCRWLLVHVVVRHSLPDERSIECVWGFSSSSFWPELSDRFGIPTASIVNLNFAHLLRMGFRQNPLQNQWTQSDAISHSHTQSHTHTHTGSSPIPTTCKLNATKQKPNCVFHKNIIFRPFFLHLPPPSPVKELYKFNLAGFSLRHCSLNCRSRMTTTQRWIQQWIALVAHNPIKFK